MKKRHSNQEASKAIRREVNKERRKAKGIIKPQVVITPAFEVASNNSKILVNREIERLMKKQLTSEEGLTLGEAKQLEIYMKISVSVNREERIHTNDQFNELMKLSEDDLEAMVEGEKLLEEATGALEPLLDPNHQEDPE